MNKEDLVKAINSMRVCVCACSCLAIIVSGVFCGFYASLWTEAISLDDSAPATYTSDVPYYDNCGGVVEIDETSLGVTDTKWTVIFTLNTVTYGCLTLFSLC